MIIPLDLWIVTARSRKRVGTSGNLTANQRCFPIAFKRFSLTACLGSVTNNSEFPGALAHERDRPTTWATRDRIGRVILCLDL